MIRLNNRYGLETETFLFVAVDAMHVYKYKGANILISDTGGISNYSVRFLTS